MIIYKVAYENLLTSEREELKEFLFQAFKDEKLVNVSVCALLSDRGIRVWQKNQNCPVMTISSMDTISVGFGEKTSNGEIFAGMLYTPVKSLVKELGIKLPCALFPNISCVPTKTVIRELGIKLPDEVTK